ncbi:hypothetical protein ACJJTC_016800 [Scirpophaga incertulas]
MYMAGAGNSRPGPPLEPAQRPPVQSRDFARMGRCNQNLYKLLDLNDNATTTNASERLEYCRVNLIVEVHFILLPVSRHVAEFRHVFRKYSPTTDVHHVQRGAPQVFVT